MNGTRSARSDLPTGEVTFLFTDIEGSTRLLVELGEAYEPLLATHAAILRRAFEDHRGVEVNTEGDAFFVVFASAADAVAAAVDAQRGLASEPWPVGHEISVRMGLHTGEGRLGGDDYAGIDVNRAARISSAAHGGQIVVSDSTATLIEGQLAEAALRSLGRHRLKDLPDAIEIWQVEAPGLATTFPALKTLDARLTNLPSDASELVGRDEEIAHVRSVLADRREVTLTGPGGTGKTRLALAVAASLVDDRPDGAILVEVEDAVDRPGVILAIATALGIREQPDRDLEASVIAYLAERSLLLVLDNFEQAIAAASLVSEVLEASPGSRIIVTSRAALRIRGEQEVPVEPLTLPSDGAAPDEMRANAAVALFLERARQVRPDLDPSDEELASIAAICRRLDGLPLAIELAAARMRMLSPAAILDRLDQALPLLRGGDRDRPERQQTLAGAIDWSHDLLDSDDRRLFAALSVFAGGWTLEAAERVCGGRSAGIDVFEGLASLTEKSLLRTTDGADDEPRFSMLAVIHEYATARAAEDPTTTELVASHAAWVAELVETAAPELTRRDLGRYQRRLHAEEENIRAALRRALEDGDATTAARIAGSLWRFWRFWGRVREGLDWLTRTQALPQDGVPDAVRATVHAGLGSLHYWIGRLDETEADYQAALKLRLRGDDAQATADAWNDLAFSAAASGRVDESHSRFAVARAGYVDADDTASVALIDSQAAVLAYAVVGEGSYDDAVTAVESGLEFQDRYGNLHDWIAGLGGLVLVHRAAGQLEKANEAMRRTLAAWLRVGDLGYLGEMLKLAASIEMELGRPERAVVIAAATRRHADEIGGNVFDSYLDTDVSEPALAALGEEAYAAAEARGRAMSILEAAEFAISADATSSG